MGLLSMLGIGNKSEKVSELLQSGAIVIDVRTKAEYSSGHVKGSHNIPLNSLEGKISKIKKLNKPVVTCCASGMRSASAASILKNNGIESINGGSWGKVNNLL